jgi:Fe-S-cluster containining protein
MSVDLPQDLFFHPCVDRFLAHPLVPSLEKRCVFLRKWKRVCDAEEVKKMCVFLRKK